MFALLSQLLFLLVFVKHVVGLRLAQRRTNAQIITPYVRNIMIPSPCIMSYIFSVIVIKVIYYMRLYLDFWNPGEKILTFEMCVFLSNEF
jgi:hypothetical protein